MNKLHKMTPARAYRAEIKRGQQFVWREVYISMCYTMLPAMYNVKDDEQMPDEDFAEYATKVEHELQRIINEVFESDPENIGKAIAESKTAENSDDKAKYFINQVNELRERLGMEKL